ncbi:hypothetical protein RUM43_010046 [Polyplax serrata]|uniref:Uncharacterized protein n=1 Tax=Polyplax serrata TaxID=468196 RepID=A0AAN8S708_POLSC
MREPFLGIVCERFEIQTVQVGGILLKFGRKSLPDNITNVPGYSYVPVHRTDLQQSAGVTLKVSLPVDYELYTNVHLT